MSNASNKICEKLVPEYTNFSDYDGKTFEGYKVVIKKHGNYYSVVSGLFRYRPKRVSQNSYHTLYYGTKHYNDKLVDKVGIFFNKEDSIKALESYNVDVEPGCHLVVVSVKLSGDLISCDYSNCSVNNVPVVLGTIIESVKEIEICQ